MKYQLSACSIWEYGKRTDAAGNPHQEDSLYPRPAGTVGSKSSAAATSERLFIVCDGMGGHDAGEVASATVCEAMSQYITSHTSPAGPFTTADLQQAIAAAFDALDAEDTGAEKKMGTTMTLLKFHDRGYTMAHMGDSRIYHLRPGKDKEHTSIVHVTSDHSLVNDLVKIGELTPEEARTSKQKNVITRAMQPHMERRPKADIHESDDIREGDYFYLCSDGMLEQMEDDNIRFIFSGESGNMQRKADMLRKATQDNRDNHTALIIRVDKVDGVTLKSDEESTELVATVSAPIVTGEWQQTTQHSASHESRNDDTQNSRTQWMLLLIIVLLAGVLYFLWGHRPPKELQEPEDPPTEQPQPQKVKPDTKKPAKETSAPESNSEGNESEAPSAEPQPDAPEEDDASQSAHAEDNQANATSATQGVLNAVTNSRTK